MSIRHPGRHQADPATEAMGNLFVAGIDIEALKPFEEAFSAEHYAILPILEQAIPIFRALGITAVKPTWQQTCRNGHSLIIADTDFTPDGVRRAIQRLRDFADTRGILIEEEPQSEPAKPEPARRSSPCPAPPRSELLEVLRDIFPAGIANEIARKISAAARLKLGKEEEISQPQREALATWLIKKYWPDSDFRAQATDTRATKFNIVNSSGKYIGYSIEISSLPPFEARILKMKKVSGRWVDDEVFCKTFQPRT